MSHNTDVDSQTLWQMVNEIILSVPLLYHDDYGRPFFHRQLLDSVFSDSCEKDPELSRHVHARDNYGRTLLHYAAEYKSPKVAQYLINLGANVNAQDNQGKTPIFVCNCSTTIETLLKAEANIYINDNRGRCALKQILSKSMESNEAIFRKLSNDCLGDLKRISETLIRMNCSIDEVIALKNVNVTRIFIENGKRFNTRTYNLHDILMKCIRSNNLNHVKFLLDEYDLDVNYEYSNGDTAITSCGINNFQMLQILLDRGANPSMIITNGRLNGGMRMTSILINSEVNKCIKLLLDIPGVLDARDTDGCTALHYLVRNKRNNVVDVLKDKVFDVNARDNSGSTPLHYAKITNLNTFKFLLDSGANVHATNCLGLTPIQKIWRGLSQDIFLEIMDVESRLFRVSIEKFHQVLDCLLYYGAEPQLTHPLNIYSDRITQRRPYHFMESILAQLALMESRGTYIKESIRHQMVMLNPWDKQNYYHTSKEQLEQMKLVKLTKTISLYELMIANDVEMKEYLRKKNVLKNLRRLKNKNDYLPYYRYILRDRVVNTIVRMKRRKETGAAVCKVIGMNFDHVITDNIIKYLSKADLRKFHCWPPST